MILRLGKWVIKSLVPKPLLAKELLHYVATGEGVDCASEQGHTLENI